MKKTALTEYDTNRTGGIIAINLREGDKLRSALLVDEHDDLLLVSRRGMSLRFTATNDTLRPMGRSTSGVKGMSFREDDTLLSASVVSDDGFVWVMTEGGTPSAPRRPVPHPGTRRTRHQGRPSRADRGDLVGALIVGEDDEVLVVLQSGKVVRSAVAEVPAKGRDTMGVVFARFARERPDHRVARNSERNLDDQEDAEIEPAGRSRPSAGRRGRRRRRRRRSWRKSPRKACPPTPRPVEAGEDESSNE